ncbi:hypothetical protein [Xanthobacter autotrophicus]|uniref:hypothetical protein n=1 Tax=Xanthobacter autotrophicus TaxID=280 RepID=UPI00372A37DB
MTNMRNILFAAGVGVFVVSASTTAAFAGCSSGFIADVLCQTGVIDRQTANTLDGVHAGMGRPLDHLANQAAGAAANYAAPGSGQVVTQGLELRDQWNRSGGMGSPGVGMPQPIPPAQSYPPLWAANGNFGNVCYTQAGAFPGPMNPIGMPCMAMTPWGGVPGTVGR